MFYERQLPYKSALMGSSSTPYINTAFETWTCAPLNYSSTSLCYQTQRWLCLISLWWLPKVYMNHGPTWFPPLHVTQINKGNWIGVCLTLRHSFSNSMWENLSEVLLRSREKPLQEGNGSMVKRIEDCSPVDVREGLMECAMLRHDDALIDCSWLAPGDWWWYYRTDE